MHSYFLLPRSIWNIESTRLASLFDAKHYRKAKSTRQQPQYDKAVVTWSRIASEGDPISADVPREEEKKKDHQSRAEAAEGILSSSYLPFCRISRSDRCFGCARRSESVSNFRQTA